MDENRSMSGMRPLRSRAITDGLDRAPHRAFLRAMGLNDEAIARPFIGVVSTAGEITPCNLTLAAQATAAKAGVAKAGGTPRKLRTPAQALSPNGGLVVLKGNLCPDGR